METQECQYPSCNFFQQDSEIALKVCGHCRTNAPAKFCIVFKNGSNLTTPLILSEEVPVERLRNLLGSFRVFLWLQGQGYQECRTSAACSRWLERNGQVGDHPH